MTLATGMEVLGGAPVFAETKKDNNTLPYIKTPYIKKTKAITNWLATSPKMSGKKCNRPTTYSFTLI